MRDPGNKGANGRLYDRRGKSYEINQTDDKNKGTCRVCGASHAVWSSDVLKSRSIQEKMGYCKEARTPLQVFG